MRRLLFLIIISGVYNFSFAQDIFEKVSKQYSFEAGYQYVFKTDFDSVSPGGYTAMIDYAWKLSGYHKKAPAYISVPLGYSYHPGEINSVSILYYGWTVRHELSKNKKVTPYLGYALLLNQLRETNSEGSIFGHQTKFELGTNFKLKERLILFTKFEYSFGRFPSLGNSKSYKIQTAEFKLGIRL